jgi:hypothetical protein
MEQERRDLVGELRQRIRYDRSHWLRPPAIQDQASAARPRMPCTLGGGGGSGGGGAHSGSISSPEATLACFVFVRLQDR